VALAYEAGYTTRRVRALQGRKRPVKCACQPRGRLRLNPRLDVPTIAAHVGRDAKRDEAPEGLERQAALEEGRRAGVGHPPYRE